MPPPRLFLKISSYQKWDERIESVASTLRHHNGVYLPLQGPVRAFMLDMYAPPPPPPRKVSDALEPLIPRS